MPTLENYTEHPYSFPRGAIAEKALTIPRGGVPMGEASNGFKPGVAVVSDEDLKAMQAHPVASTWFNRDGLVIKDGPAASAKASAK